MRKALNCSFDAGLLEFGLICCLWSEQQMNLNPNLKSFIACENKTNQGGFQVQNVFFLDCPTMIALDFCIRRYGCFKFGLFMLERSKNMC